jgi:hypothetical protein
VFVHWIHDRHLRQRSRDLQDHSYGLSRQIEELRRDQAAAQARELRAPPSGDLTTLSGT